MQNHENRLAERSDAELVQLLVEGNHDAMGVLFDRYYRLVMSVALRIVRDRAEAQDVVQVVFTDFYRQAKLFDLAKGSLKTWMLQYAYGRSINRRKSLKARSFYDRLDLQAVDPARLAKSSKVLDFESPEATRLIEQMLDSLKDLQRKVIEMVCFEGMTMAEVAELTGESFGNVQHAYYRGIEKLRVYLKKCDEVAKAAQGAESLTKPVSAFRRLRRAGGEI